MAFETFQYSKSWENPEDFPAYEPDETRVRADLQCLHDEAAAAINALIAALNDPSAASNIPFAAEGMEAKTLQQAIELVYAAVGDAAAALIVDGSVSKQKLEAELLRRIYGGKVWVSADLPTAAHNPDADFPVGQLWLRPGMTVTNLAMEDWETAGCTAVRETDGWSLTSDGSADYMTASQLLQSVCRPGQSLSVWVQPGECSSGVEDVEVYINGVEYDPAEGVIEAVADRTGSVEILLRASLSEEIAGESVQLDRLAVVSLEDTFPEGWEPCSDRAAILEALGSAAQVQIPKALYIQTEPGVWQELIGQILPVHRGGTGLDGAAKGALLYGTGEQTMAALPAEEAGILQCAGGVPQWVQPDALAQKSGYLRTMEGDYQGIGGNEDRTLTLPVTPKILFLSAGDGSEDTICLTDGGRSSKSYCIYDGNLVVSYEAQVLLQGTVLTFTNERRGNYGSQMVSGHMNAEGVGYHWLAVY